MLVVLGAVLGGFGFWLRGSTWFHYYMGRGAPTARLVCWALPLGLLTWTLTEWYYAAAFGVALFLGSLLGWWDSLDLGRREGTWAKDFALHTLRGVCWTLPAAAVNVALHLDPLAAVWLLGAGLMCGVVYEIGWRVWPARATEVGEVLFGALGGAALIGGIP